MMQQNIPQWRRMWTLYDRGVITAMEFCEFLIYYPVGRVISDGQPIEEQEIEEQAIIDEFSLEMIDVLRPLFLQRLPLRIRKGSAKSQFQEQVNELLKSWVVRLAASLRIEVIWKDELECFEHSPTTVVESDSD